MAKDSLVNEIHDRKNVSRTFEEIRLVLQKATSGEDLTDLYKQAVYMILMTHSSPVNEKDQEMKRRRKLTEQEFARTVRLINERAKKIGLEAVYSENWQNIATNGYVTESDNSLEAQENIGFAKE